MSEYTDLACPVCRQAMKVDVAAGRVDACAHFRAARIENGVLALIEPHGFYEGRFTGVDPFILPRAPSAWRKLMAYCRHSSLTNANQFFLWKWLERAVQEHGRLRILDIGCGSGKVLLTQYGDVHGIDYSVSSLDQNRGIYKQVMQCDATMVPYPDCYFDFILSDNVLGHVPFDRKDAVIGEVARLLRPGGLTLHIVEAMSLEYRLFRLIDANAFREECVERNGHVGLESCAAINRRFMARGLRRVRACHGHILAVARRYAEHYGGTFAQRHILVRPFTWAMRMVGNARALAGVFDRAMRVLNAGLRAVTPLGIPAGCLFWGVYRKPGSSGSMR